MSDFNLSEEVCSSPERSVPSCDIESVKTDVFELREGLDVRVTRNTKSMRSIANLVLTVNVLSKSLSHCGKDLSNDKLCSAIMDCVAKESAFQKVWHSSSSKCKYIRSNCWRDINLCDMYQKDLMPTPGKSKLQAITLSGGQDHCKVKFEMSSYRPPCTSDFSSMIVLLSINDKLHISCSKENGNIFLNLEDYSMDSLKEICEDDNVDRFLFIKTTCGKNLTTFESVKYPGWYISTSFDKHDTTVEMCQATAASRVTSFKVL